MVEALLRDGIFRGKDAERYGLRFPSYRAFFPEELEEALRGQGFIVADVRGVASLCRLVSSAVLERVVSDSTALEQFLDLERAYTARIGRRSPAQEWLVLARRPNA